MNEGCIQHCRMHILARLPVIGMVFKILPDGTLSAAASRPLSGPTGLAHYSPDGSLLVLEVGAQRLSRIDSNGSVTTLAEGLKVEYSAGLVNGVAVGQSGAIYVTGNKANVLYRIEIHP